MGKGFIFIGGSQMSEDNGDFTLSDAQKLAIRELLIQFAGKLLGIPYEFGAEWTDFGKVPESLDCSELVEGVYVVNRLKMPDGSQNQYDFTLPAGDPKPGDLAFFGKGASPAQIYHVGMVYDAASIIEARALDPLARFETGKVILRPRKTWAAYKNFVGYR